MRVRQPFVVLGLFFWSGKKLPFASVRMFLPLAMEIYLPSRKYSAMNSPNGKGFSQQKPLFFHIYKQRVIRREPKIECYVLTKVKSPPFF